MAFDVYQDEVGKSRWRFAVANAQAVATPGEAFASKGNAKRGGRLRASGRPHERPAARGRRLVPQPKVAG